MKDKKNLFIIYFLFISISIMMITLPSKYDYDSWIANEYDIVKDTKKPGIYLKNGKEYFEQSYNEKGFGIFKTVEQKLRYRDGEYRIIRAFGILNNFFTMK